MSTQQFDEAFEQWLRNHRYTADAQTIVKIGQRVRENLERLGGIVAAASFERAYLELVSSGSIKAFKGTVTDHVAAAESPMIPQEIINYIENPRISALEMSRRYRSDSTFRAQYDAYERVKKGQEVQPSDVLTAEQYHRIPAATVAARYQKDPGFRAQVDALIAQGRI